MVGLPPGITATELPITPPEFLFSVSLCECGASVVNIYREKRSPQRHKEFTEAQSLQLGRTLLCLDVLRQNSIGFGIIQLCPR
jgi:hypothetical protein